MYNILWILIFIFFILSIIGSFIPIIPDIIPLWLGIIIYIYFIPSATLSTSFFITLAIITVITVGADFAVNALFVKKAGGSKLSIIAAMVSLLLAFIIGPLGVILGPFIGVFLLEYFINRNRDQAFKIAISTIFAYFSSGVVKFLLQIFVIIYFVIEII